MWKRSLKGALLGTVITFGVGAIVVALIFWLCYLGFGNLSFQEGHFFAFFKALPWLVLASAIIGTPAGIAARLPRHGLRMLTSIGIVALFTIVGGGILLGTVFVPPDHKGIPLLTMPFGVTFSTYLGTALAGGLVVLACGWWETKELLKQAANESNDSDAIQGE